MEKKKDIRQDLIDQLQAKGKYQKYYVDLVDDYMKYYDLKKKLQADIKTKGLRYATINGNGIEVEKPNESIQNIVKVSSMMLKILTDLGLQEPEAGSSDEGDYY